MFFASFLQKRSRFFGTFLAKQKSTQKCLLSFQKKLPINHINIIINLHKKLSTYYILLNSKQGLTARIINLIKIFWFFFLLQIKIVRFKALSSKLARRSQFLLKRNGFSRSVSEQSEDIRYFFG